MYGYPEKGGWINSRGTRAVALHVAAICHLFPERRNRPHEGHHDERGREIADAGAQRAVVRHDIAVL
ncbi:MAG: hypothetical protein FJX72_09350 [Armatimonadetes bacterium]|nr:hypothetical protein [Armatimonadota bacterium]